MSLLSPEWRAAVAQDRAPGESTWLGRLRCRDHGHTNAAGIVEHVTGADGRDDPSAIGTAEQEDCGLLHAMGRVRHTSYLQFLLSFT